MIILRFAAKIGLLRDKQCNRELSSTKKSGLLVISEVWYNIQCVVTAFPLRGGDPGNHSTSSPSDSWADSGDMKLVLLPLSESPIVNNYYVGVYIHILFVQINIVL